MSREPLALPLPPELIGAISQRVAEILRDEVGNDSPWMTRTEAAAYMRLPLSRLEKDKAIPCHREGRRVLYNRHELDVYLFSKLDTPSKDCLDSLTFSKLDGGGADE